MRLIVKRDFILLLATAWLAGCATPPAARVATRAEIVERDNTLGTELAAQFEAQVQLKNDREVMVYLRKLAQQLSATAPDLASTNVGVLILRDGREKGATWKSFGVPGNRIYLSAALVKRLEFENEVAAMIAFQLGHIQRRHLMERVQEAQSGVGNDYPSVSDLGGTKAKTSIDFFGPRGAFAFSEEQELETVDSAVELLYRSGYDPRGLIGVWNRLSANLAQSPFEASTLQKLIERTRRSISGYAPLLNPIVRSTGFIAIQKRIKKL